MNPKLLLALALVLSGGLFATTQAQPADATDATRIRLEQMTTHYSHFSLEAVIRNRPLRLWGVMEKPQSGASRPAGWKPNPLVEEQARLVQELRSVDGDRPALAALLKHPDPKVRTLALGAIFQREDGRDLPLIASLVNDSATTFTNLHNVIGSMPGQALSDFENPQTVGQVAGEMLAFWGVPHEGRPVRMGYGDGFEAGITTDDFAGYWKKYAGRDYAASWFAVRMKRATRETDPLQPEYRADIDRVISDMRALPAPDGLWIQLYVLAPGNQFTTRLVPDDELIAVAKKLGPDALLRFLQRQKVSDDPDLRLDKDDGLFVGISNFILDHARPAISRTTTIGCRYRTHVV
jgi:hypothetical protein